MNDFSAEQPAPDSAEPSFFDAVETSGWVNFRVRRPAGGSIPARIGKNALKEIFGQDEGETLLDTYVRHAAAINAKVLQLAPAGNLYSVENPMTIGSSDFP